MKVAHLLFLFGSAAAKGGFTLAGLKHQNILIWFLFWGIEWFASTNKQLSVVLLK